MATSVVEGKVTAKVRPQKVAVIDTDIHVTMPSPKTVLRYLPKRWHKHHEIVGGRGIGGPGYPRIVPNAARHDSWPPNGGPPGSDLDFLREQLLDQWEMDYGIMTPLMGAGGQANLEYGAALATAWNDWQLEEWVEKEPRIRASVLVAYEDGELAAREIDRIGGHPAFLQVFLVVRTRDPLGHRKYWKMYEAAERHDLPIAVHFGGHGNGPITGTGWPSHYIEDHGGMPQAFQPQVASLVLEGVFERFPTLKVVLIEGGFAWLPPLMWRLDRCWQRLGEEVPQLQKPPSHYVREHFWVSTQPMEEPPKKSYFHQLLNQMDMNDRLIFATDYPHWDFDSPKQAVPSDMDPELRRAIMADNARRLYRLNSPLFVADK